MSWKTSILLLALAIAACKEAPQPAPVPEPVADMYAHPEALIEAPELQETLRVAGIRLVDFRKPSAYAAGHIPGAVNLWRPDIEDPNGEVPGLAAPAAAVEALMSRSGISATDTLIIYDDEAGCNAARLWWVLQYYGYTKIRLLNGGIQAWEAMGGPMTDEIGSPAPTAFRFAEAAHPESVINAIELHGQLGAKNLVVLDTRTPDEFSGHRQKAGAKRAGHIPGSINMDWAGATDYNGDKRFKSPEALRKQYAFLGSTDSTDVVAYCHSGVRSAHTYFVLTELLGYRQVRNFDGSWLQWSAWAEAPIEQDSITQIFE